MTSPTHPLKCTIEDVLKTSEATLKEYTSIFQRFFADGHALSAPPPLQTALAVIHDCLESAVDDAEMVERLGVITIQSRGQYCQFLIGLNSDLQSICHYLQSTSHDVGPSYVLEKDKVEMFAQTLGQYSKVLKTAEKKNAAYVDTTL
jgi:hypothetical protein